VQARQLLGLRALEPQQGIWRDKLFGHTTAGLFGYTHLTGGYPGGQAEYCACPSRTRRTSRSPHLTDEQVLFLGDIFPTGWQAAVQCDIQPTDTVAIWGAGRSARWRSAARSCSAPSRWSHRPRAGAPRHGEAGGAITINFEEESVVERLNELTDGKGPEKCIDASAWRRTPPPPSIPCTTAPSRMVMLETDRPHVLREMIYVCRPGRRPLDPRRLWRAARQDPVRRGS
jgi:threonine dehydrogenase-like Zn-dependent dehydrogenase